jgi:hypothetical protein
MPRRAALVLAVTLLSLSARAELVEVDLDAPGDKLVTRDTETGLDWLDVGGVTTGYSYDSIQGGAGGWLASGWRYATQAEVCALFVAHANVPTCTFNSGAILNDGRPTVLFINHLTRTDTIFGDTYFRIQLEGLYDDGTAGARARIEIALPFPPPFFMHAIYSDATPDAFPSDYATVTRGSFLVRATPPEIPALPIAGIAALAALLALAAPRAVAS